MTTLDVLKAARELIRDERAWTQGALARATDGKEVRIFDACAVCWCAVGALDRVAWDAKFTVPGHGSTLYHLVNALDPEISIGTFNDTHTHAEVLALFDRAIARLESEAADA